MSDEIESAISGSETPSNVEPPPVFYVPPAIAPTGPHLMKRFLACNPFYLISAALLLYGMYRTSIDKSFLPTEVGQLTFNFTSLQFYELLLVGTAVVLARRRIWYDSTLLLVLENLFVLVPFYLISQAGLIDQQLTGLLSGAAVLIAVGRISTARRWIPPLQFSRRLLSAGGILLIVNATLPVIYRHLHEHKFGTKPTDGAAYDMNLACWLYVLPLLCALPMLLPRPRDNGELVVQRRWFPISLVLLWLAGTGTHLYALGYIYDFDLSREWVAPALCVLAWAFHFRLTDFVETPSAQAQATTLMLPLTASLIALGVEDGNIFFALTALNVVMLTGVALFRPENRLARQLASVAFTVLIASVPYEWTTSVTANFDRVKLIGILSAGYLLLAAAISRSPKVGLAGTLAAACAAAALRGGHPDAGAWAMQTGLAFLLLHSLRWNDVEHQGARGVRILTASVWVFHAWVWAGAGAAFWQPMMFGVIVLAGYFIRMIVVGDLFPKVVPLAGAAVVLSSPVYLGTTAVQSAPAGVLAIIGSFVLFAIGTMTALTKHRWHKHEPAPKENL